MKFTVSIYCRQVPTKYASKHLDDALLLEILVRLAVVNVALVVLKLLHSLLLEDLVPALQFQLFGHYRKM